MITQNEWAKYDIINKSMVYLKEVYMLYIPSFQKIILGVTQYIYNDRYNCFEWIK